MKFKLNDVIYHTGRKQCEIVISYEDCLDDEVIVEFTIRQPYNCWTETLKVSEHLCKKVEE